MPTYGIMVETQISHEIAELSVLQRRPSEHGIKFMKGCEEYLALHGDKQE